MPAAPANLAVQPVETARSEADDRLRKPAKAVARRRPPPSAPCGNSLDDKRKPRRRLIADQIEDGGAPRGRLSFRRTQKPVEARLVGKVRQRTSAKRLDEHVPVARLAEDSGDPFRTRPADPEIRRMGRPD